MFTASLLRSRPYSWTYPDRNATECEHMTSLRPLTRWAAALALLAAAACGGSDDDAGAAGGGKTVTIVNFEFAPDTLQVKVGDTITVDNKDQTEHTVTARDKSFDTGSFTGTKTFTVSKAGTFEYICEIHPFMPHRFIQVSG